ncbi:hypothetical protein BBJ28_00000167 [Nothophytophthora sp. Chile5]|nr:hypothetical protein BBJ28_00000167 [Nothophytophthora sp. Chile5]
MNHFSALVVVHHVDGGLTPEAIDQLAFLASNEEGGDVPPKYGETNANTLTLSSYVTVACTKTQTDVVLHDVAFPQSPKLLWLLQNVTTSELKEQVQGSGLSLQDTEQVYLSNAMTAQPADSPGGAFCELFQSVFPDQACFTIPPKDSDAFPKRMEKLMRLFMDSIHNRYMKGVVLNGPLLGSIVVSMLAHRDNVFKAFKGRIWKDTIHNCCLNIVENGVKLYKLRMFERLGSVVDISDLKGFKPTLTPLQKEELAKFTHNVIRPQLAEFSEKLELVRQHDVDVIDEAIEKSEDACEEFNAKQKHYQRETMNAQADVNRQLVEVAKLHALRKEALVGAINDLTNMHGAAAKQKELLEEAAFVSVQLPEQKVIEAAQDKETTELQGYLIKQGGGGNVLNPLGRKNWKQRYFILIGVNLIYARTKDDYERGKIIKELCLTGFVAFGRRRVVNGGVLIVYLIFATTRCRIDPSRDAGEGFNIIPGKAAHVFELQRGLFEKNSKKRSSAVDSGRTFKLRAQSIEERDVWINKLRQAAGGY